MTGLVVKNTGSWYLVKCQDDNMVNCKIKGNFRLKGIRTTNPVAVGDIVDLDINKEGTAFITNIHERKNYIIRKSSNLSKQAHILASNLDLALLVITVNYPETSTVFIDRFLATAQAYRVPVHIVINKSDRYDENDINYINALKYLYEGIGYPCHLVSAKTLEGIDALKEVIKGKVSLISGNSGVGKSTLINAILPELALKTGEISDVHNTGMHTTTFSEMFQLEDGGYLIDTPGVKGFGTIDFETEEVAHFFPEIFKISVNCKFNNCTHRHEPGCAVLKALEEHRISESRYNSYLSIIEDSTEGKYRSAF
jgi:ribosome small subunit-dependent GTPase A